MIDHRRLPKQTNPSAQGRALSRSLLLLWLLAGLLPGVLNAAQTVPLPGQWIESIPRPDNSFGAYRISVEDLRVKILGGHLRVTRRWDEDRWRINPRWTPVTETPCTLGTGGCGADPAGGVVAITRLDLSYRKSADNEREENGVRIREETYTEARHPRWSFTRISERIPDAAQPGGWRYQLWQNRRGDWIDYATDDGPVRSATAAATATTPPATA